MTAAFTLRHELFRSKIAPIVYDSIVILYDKIKINKDGAAFKALYKLMIEIVMGYVSFQESCRNFERDVSDLPHKSDYMREILSMYGRFME